MEQKADVYARERVRSFKEGGIRISIVVAVVTACEYTIKLFCAQASDVLYMQIRVAPWARKPTTLTCCAAHPHILYFYHEELFLASSVSSFRALKAAVVFPFVVSFFFFDLATFRFLRKLSN